jgi:hypothetical protein
MQEGAGRKNYFSLFAFHYSLIKRKPRAFMGGAYKEVLSHSISDLKSEVLWRFLLTMQRCYVIIAINIYRD